MKIVFTAVGQQNGVRFAGDQDRAGFILQAANPPA
jgi:hypothetical protein